MSNIALEKHLKSISEISYDKSNNEYMTDSMLKAVDFDEVKNQFVSTMGTRGCPAPRSNDALYIDRNDDYYFIEFKNGKINNYELMQKNYDSTFILAVVLSEKFEILKKKLNYILVYNETKYPNEKVEDRYVQESAYRDKIGKNFSKKSNTSFVKFNQGFFENYLFSKVYTLDKSEFQNMFISKWELKDLDSDL